MRIINTVSPLTKCLIYGIFQCLCSACHRMHLRTQQFHTIYIQCLTLGILFSHKHFTFHSEECCDRSCCHTMLSGSCLRDQAFFAHSFCQQGLAKRIVQFMRSGMVQIFSFQINLRTSQIFCHTIRIAQKAWSAYVSCQHFIILSYKIRILLIFSICLFQFDYGIHQCFRDILSPVNTKTSSRFRHYFHLQSS